MEHKEPDQIPFDLGGTMVSGINIKADLTDEQQSCVKSIAEERSREEIELEYVQKLQGEDLNRELQRINKSYSSKLTNCIGKENYQQLFKK